MKLLLLVAVLVAVASAQFNGQFWTKEGSAGKNTFHSVVIGINLVEGAAATCDSMLMARSTPGSALYGKHLTFAQVGAKFRNPEAEAQTKAWLRRNRISAQETKFSPNGEFVRVTTTVRNLERLLRTSLNVYSAVEDKSLKIVRNLDYKIPPTMHFIDFVSDMYTLPVPPSMKRRLISTSKSTNSDGNVSPSLLWDTYNIKDHVITDPKSTQAVFESMGQSYEPSDLKKFQAQFNLIDTPIAKVLGPNSATSCAENPNACAEASLDVEWMLAVAENATTWFWSIPGQGDIFVQWIEAVSSTSDAPLIHSISYGSLAPESPEYNIDRFNTEVCKIGLRGITVFVSSGDDGVANFVARGNPGQCGFTPSYPATCQYVTAVGATQGPEAGNPEIGCSSQTGGLITSGGGFSTYLKRPDYQDKAVTAYLKNGPGMPPRSKFSSQGRAYPDVAGMGHNYEILVNGESFIGSGTSCSSPVTAAIFNTVNEARLQAGKSSLGFINPALYDLGVKESEVFNDITVGRNNCCAGSPGSQTCCEYGFNATKGWDAMTGWGSFNAEKLKEVFMNL